MDLLSRQSTNIEENSPSLGKKDTGSHFYKEFPEIVDTVCRQTNIRLLWSHYRELLQMPDVTAREWYEKETYEQTMRDDYRKTYS